MDGSDWDSDVEPEELPPPKSQPTMTKEPNEEVRADSGQVAVGDGGSVPPPVSPRRSNHRQPKPKQRPQEPRQSEPRQSEPRQSEPRQSEPRQSEPRQSEPRQSEPRQSEPRQSEPRQSEPRQSEPRQKQTGRQKQQEEQPPFNFRPEADDGQRGSSRQKPQPPGRPQRSEYAVPARKAPAMPVGDPETSSVAILRDPGLVSPSPRPRPRSARTLPLLFTDESTALRAAISHDGILLQPLSSPGVVRHSSSPALDHATSAVPQPPSSNGPRSSSETNSPLEETETATLAVVVSSYKFSQPDLRVLRSGDQNPSRLLGRFGKLSHRYLMQMWSEVMWVASVPILLITTFLFALMRCLLEVVVRPVTLGPIQLLGDHLLKPAAVTLYDALLLPAATLLANTLSALALVGRPLGETVDALVRPLATLLASCRLVQVSYGTQQQQQQQRAADGPHQV